MLSHIAFKVPTTLVANRVTSVCVRFPPDFISKCMNDGAIDILRIHIHKLNAFEVINAAITHQQYSLLSSYTDMSLYKPLWNTILSDVKMLESILLHLPTTFIRPLFRRAAITNKLDAIEFLCNNYPIILQECDPLRYSIKYCKVSVTKLLLKYFTPTLKHVGYRSYTEYYLAPHVLVAANPKLIRYYYPHIFGLLGVVILLVLTYVLVTVVK